MLEIRHLLILSLDLKRSIFQQILGPNRFFIEVKQGVVVWMESELPVLQSEFDFIASDGRRCVCEALYWFEIQVFVDLHIFSLHSILYKSFNITFWIIHDNVTIFYNRSIYPGSNLFLFLCCCQLDLRRWQLLNFWRWRGFWSFQHWLQKWAVEFSNLFCSHRIKVLPFPLWILQWLDHLDAHFRRISLCMFIQCLLSLLDLGKAPRLLIWISIFSFLNRKLLRLQTGWGTSNGVGVGGSLLLYEEVLICFVIYKSWSFTFF